MEGSRGGWRRLRRASPLRHRSQTRRRALSALLDTSVLVDFLRGREPAGELLRAAVESDEQLAASALTRIELSIGMRPDERVATDALIGALAWLLVDDDVTEEADRLARRFGRSHSGIDAVDYCIAASAIVHGLDLWTLNVRHFPMFDGLRPPW